MTYSLACASTLETKGNNFAHEDVPIVEGVRRLASKQPQFPRKCAFTAKQLLWDALSSKGKDVCMHLRELRVRL